MNDFRLYGAYLAGKVRRVYFMALPENKKDLKRSRILYTIGDSATQAVAQLITGTFMATLLSYVGVADGNIGIITSIVSLTAIFQVVSMGWVEKMKKRKLWVCASVLQKGWFAFLYFIPFLSWNGTQKKLVILLCLVFAQICVHLGTPASLDWIASLIPDRLRGRYLARKDAAAVLVTVTTILLMGIVLDLTKRGHILWGFAAIGATIFLLTAVNVISFSMMKEPKLSYLNEEGKEMHGHLAKRAKEKQPGKKLQVRKEFTEAFCNLKFRRALLINCMWMTAFYIAAPFNASYQIKELSLPYTFLMTVNFLASLVRVAVTPGAGRMADRAGMGKVLKYSVGIMGISYGLLIFTTPRNGYWLFPVTAVIAAAGWSFIPVGLLGIQLEFLEPEKRTLQLALIAAISGIYGFFVSVAGGKLVNLIQHSGLHLGGRIIYAQQITNLLGFLAILCMVLYLHFSIQDGKSAKHKKGAKREAQQNT